MIYYSRKYIPLKDREVGTIKKAYSYRWHFDMPNSSNMLKIFLPINIDKNLGPLEVINRRISKNITDPFKINNGVKKLFLEGKKNLIYGFYPTVCCHRDGIPNENFIASQIMFQLNPSKTWQINSRMFEENSSKKNKFSIWTPERKFPFFSYLFDKKIDLY